MRKSKFPKPGKRTHLEFPHDPAVVLELLLALLAPVELEGLQPLREPVKLRLGLQLVGVDLHQGHGGLGLLPHGLRTELGLGRARHRLDPGPLALLLRGVVVLGAGRVVLVGGLVPLGVAALDSALLELDRDYWSMDH